MGKFSEYGEKWHEAGMRERKQNVFDDFIYAARYLIDSGYTNSKRFFSLKLLLMQLHLLYKCKSHHSFSIF